MANITIISDNCKKKTRQESLPRKIINNRFPLFFLSRKRSAGKIHAGGEAGAVRGGEEKVQVQRRAVRHACGRKREFR